MDDDAKALAVGLDNLSAGLRRVEASLQAYREEMRSDLRRLEERMDNRFAILGSAVTRDDCEKARAELRAKIRDSAGIPPWVAGVISLSVAMATFILARWGR